MGSSAISSVGFAGERHGDHHALALAAGELVRIIVEPAGGIGKPHALQHGDGAGAQLRGLRLRLMGGHRLDDLRADRERRVEAGHRLLEDHRDAPSAHVAHRRRAQFQKILAVEDDGTAGDPARRRNEAHDREGERMICRILIRRRWRGCGRAR